MSLHMVYIHFETLLWPLFVFPTLPGCRAVWNESEATANQLETHLSIKAPSVYSPTASFASLLLQIDGFFLALAASFRVTHEQVVHCILKILSVEGKHLLHPCFQRTYWCTFSLCRHIHACQVEAVNKRQTIMMSRHPAVVTWWHSVRRSPDIIPLSFVHTV